MEEEYRLQKQKPEGPTLTEPSNGPSVERTGDQTPSSTRAIHSKEETSSSASAESTVDGGNGERPSLNGLQISTHEIPTIKISSESDRDVPEGGLELTRVESSTGDGGVGRGVRSSAILEEEVLDPTTAGNELEKPELAQHPGEGAGGDDVGGVLKEGEAVEDVVGEDRSSFSTKRLCERWLDNLFMVLYEVCFSFLFTLRLRSSGG